MANTVRRLFWTLPLFTAATTVLLLLIITSRPSVIRSGTFLTETHYDDSPASLAPGGTIHPSLFNFTSTKPAWLTPSRPNSLHVPHHQAGDPIRSTAPSLPDVTPRPLVLRIGIISQPSEFEKRKVFREYILRDVLLDEVQFEYKFMIGQSSGHGIWADEDRLVLEEQQRFRDIHLLDMTESKLRLGEKRWRMLNWASEAPSSTYDFYLSADTDAFFRLAALARRLRHLRPDLASSARTKSILWGNLQQHYVHFKSPFHRGSDADANASIPDGRFYYDDLTDEFISLENEALYAPAAKFPESSRYLYPIGFGYLLSSHLVDALTAPEVQLPHHVHYPEDDVMIGNWVSDWAPSTVLINDQAGFHDPIKWRLNPALTANRTRLGYEKMVDYDSVCVHHLNTREMKGLRFMSEFEMEWMT